MSLWMMALVLLAGCGIGGRSEPKTQGVPAGPETEASPTPLPASPASKVILMDGELVAASPSLALSFPGNVSGELLTLNAQVGQRIRAGELIATLDDGELRKAVEDARIALDRAIEDQVNAEADAEDTYRRQVDEAQKTYENELRQARQTLEAAQATLERAEMQPPTTSLAETKANLAEARSQEAQAYDDYKQSLDRPWEPQRIRDSLYTDWQLRIVDRELAELRLQDAQIALEVHYLELEAKAKDVENAEADLTAVKGEPVQREETLSYGRAVEDAERALADAEQALEDARLYAPKDGLIVSVDANVGAEVSSSTSIATLLDPKNLYFVTENLSERHVAQLRTGQPANITLRTYPDTVLAGVVDSVIPQSERTTDADARFAAYVRLTHETQTEDETDLDLLPGMTGRVEVITEQE